MKYMGSKSKIAKHILPIMLHNRKNGQYWVEPFVGGANMIDKVSGNRIGADINPYLISMWKALQDGWIPDYYSRDQYKHIKKHTKEYPEHVVGYVGFNCSYCGVFLSGYAGEITTKDGKIRDYQKEALKNVSNQINNLREVKFINCKYNELEIPKDSIVYCDPPYANTTEYHNSGFDHEKFWDWCRQKVKEGHKVFVSEYTAPDDFICIWELEVKSSLAVTSSLQKSKKSTEKLFVHNSQAQIPIF